MASFLIQGGKRLRGKVRVSGSKNAALPILAATLLTDETCVIRNVPDIEDVWTLLKILEALGSHVEFQNHTVTLQTKKRKPENIPYELACHIRASVLLLGPLLAREKKVTLPYPGGCVIGARSLKTHFDALEWLGAKRRRTQKEEIGFERKMLIGTKITLSEFSVTATENTVMAASLAKGITEIRLAATEPHVQDLCHFLRRMGAKIDGIGTHTLRVKGVKKLHGATHTITPDYLETGTLALAALVTKGRVTLLGVDPEHLDTFWHLLHEMGAKFHLGKNSVELFPSLRLKAPERLQTNVYPGFPTDLQPPFAILLTQSRGKTKIHEALFEGRFKYLPELKRMGARYTVENEHEAFISGPTVLRGRPVKSWDIRAGAAMILAGLAARGKTLVSDIYYIDRGYERLEEKLRSLGANITRLS